MEDCSGIDCWHAFILTFSRRRDPDRDQFTFCLGEVSNQRADCHTFCMGVQRAIGGEVPPEVREQRPGGVVHMKRVRPKA